LVVARVRRSGVPERGVLVSETRRPRWKRIFWIAGPLTPVLILLVLGLAGYGGMNYASTPEFCASCHSMSSHFDSWQVSPHAPEVTCIECHSDPGALGELAAHVKGVRMLYKTIANIAPHLVMDHKIANTSCTKCHEMEDEKAKGVRVDHKNHLDKGVNCQDCHFGLVHLANEDKPGNERFHNICMGCHEEKGVVLQATGSTSCTACHTTNLEQRKPADHATDWLAKHGETAVAGQNCGACHMAATAGTHSRMSNPAFFKTDKTDDACAECHKIAMPHTSPYLLSHGADARSMGSAVCANCHSPQTPISPKPDHAAANFCSSCHSGVTMPHDKDWMSRHGAAAGTSDNPVCLTCHSSANRVNPGAEYAANNYCVKCHNGYDMPHTEKFVSQHGTLAQKSGISCMVCHSALNPVNPTGKHASSSYCAACHSDVKHPAGWVGQHGAKANESCLICHSEEKGGQNSCQACHNGKPSEKNLFHLDRYWFINHRAAAKAQGEETCKKCHAEIQPSCSNCHSTR